MPDNPFRVYQPGIYFDASRQRYIRVLESGKTRAIPESVINRDIQRFASYTRNSMRDLTAQYVNGEISHEAWYTQMRVTMKESYRQSILVANGGPETMTPSSWGSFGAEMRKQYAYLDNFSAEITNGKQPLNGTAVRRAGMYGDANYAQYQNWKLKQEVKAGFALEGRRVLHAAESCHTSKDRPGCVELAALGWMPVSEIIPIGSATCLSHCKCQIITRKVKVKNDSPTTSRPS